MKQPPIKYVRKLGHLYQVLCGKYYGYGATRKQAGDDARKKWNKHNRLPIENPPGCAVLTRGVAGVIAGNIYENAVLSTEKDDLNNDWITYFDPPR